MIPESTSWVGLVLADGRYRVTAKLGEGGMGFVYRARDLRLDTEMVIKVPRRDMLEDADFAARFTREIRSLVRLAHPHVVKLTDVGEHDGLPFAVMQYLSGGSLRDRQCSGPDGQPVPESPKELDAWLFSVAAALDFIHERRHIHRDVKPDNILFDDLGNVYLSDFGIAKVLADNLADKPKTVHTATGVVLGTPHYMAPELILGKPYDGRADQYALAVTVYEVLSSRLPADGPTPAAILMQRTAKPLVPLDELLPGIPERVSAAVSKALSLAPSDRFPDCTAFARMVLDSVAKMAATSGHRATSASGSWAVPDRASPAYKVSCPRCRKPLSLSPAALGKLVRCGSCEEVFQAPAECEEALPQSRQLISDTSAAEHAWPEIPTAARSGPPVVTEASSTGMDISEPSPDESADELSLYNQTSNSGARGPYLFLAISLALALGLLGLFTLLFLGRENDDKQAARPVQPAQNQRIRKEDEKEDKTQERTREGRPPSSTRLQPSLLPLPSENLADNRAPISEKKSDTSPQQPTKPAGLSLAKEEVVSPPTEPAKVPVRDGTTKSRPEPGSAPPASRTPSETGGELVYLIDLAQTSLVCAMPANWNKGEMTVNRVPYSKGLRLIPLPNTGLSQVTYHLKRQYSRFKAMVAIEDNPKSLRSAAPLIFEVWADSKQRALWVSKPVQKSGETQECDLNIKGVNYLQLLIRCRGPSDGAFAVWVDPCVFK
jgi:serine/threonine-protein kinase